MKCQDRHTHQKFAVKIVKASHDVTKEVETLKACQGNKNIVKLIEVMRDVAYTYIVMELLEGGELFERIRASDRFTEQEACTYFRQIVSAVAFMHKHGIAHRDLKPENMLFLNRESHILKIVDFGFATETNSTMNTPCFTLGYAAPEMLFGHGSTYTEACDLWSLGVILYTMLCGQTPFLPKAENRERHDKYINDMASRIQRGSFDTDTDYWHLVSDSARHLVTGLLTVDVKNRFDMKQVLNHPWLQFVCPKSTRNITPSLSTPSLHTPGNQDLFVCEMKDTFDAFSHAQKLGFRLQEVGNAKLAQRRRHKKSTSCSRSSDESSTSELGRSKSSSNIIITSDPNGRSISSGVATASSDAEYKPSSSNSVSYKKPVTTSDHYRHVVISISDDEDDCPTTTSIIRTDSLYSDRHDTMAQLDQHFDITNSFYLEPDYHGANDDPFNGCTHAEMKLDESTKQFTQKWLKRPLRGVSRRRKFDVRHAAKMGPTTRSRIRTRRPSGSLQENNSSIGSSSTDSTSMDWKRGHTPYRPLRNDNGNKRKRR